MSDQTAHLARSAYQAGSWQAAAYGAVGFVCASPGCCSQSPALRCNFPLSLSSFHPCTSQVKLQVSTPVNYSRKNIFLRPFSGLSETNHNSHPLRPLPFLHGTSKKPRMFLTHVRVYLSVLILTYHALINGIF